MSPGADVAYAFRTIARSRLTSGAVILTLALGISPGTLPPSYLKTFVRARSITSSARPLSTAFIR